MNGTFKIPESVIEDTYAFRGEVAKFLAGDHSPIAFRAIRVPMGIYEQRENGTYMVRVRGAGGVFLPDQATVIARLSEEFGDGIVHATTRQDFQIHRVLVEDLPTVLEKLLEAGLSPRGGGGNTVRNVTACPRAGVCPDEVFDVTPYAVALTEYLLANRANFNLPRKFKISFSGCSKDCALACVADIGFYAHEREGTRGFAVYAGGGMGAQSALSIPIEHFIPEDAIFEVAEAVKRLFDKHGDRANKQKARLRFVVERVGEEEFRRLYREELDQVRREEIVFPEIRIEEQIAVQSDRAPAVSDPAFNAWREINVYPQKQENVFTVRINLPLGNIPSAKLIETADVASSLADGTLRTTQEQDLQLRNVSAGRLHDLYKAIEAVDKDYVSVSWVKCVSCAGASTCRLGLCLSRGISTVIEEELRDLEIPFDSPIRISGCPNACGQHPVAPVGLFGCAVRVDGKLAPMYAITAGGRIGEGNAALGEFVAKAPAKAIPALLREFWTAAKAHRRDGESINELIDRWGADYLRELGEKYERIPSYAEAPEFYRDFGSSEDFSLAGRGPGECGAGVMDVIAFDLDDAKAALKEGDLYRTVVATARALLVTRGLEVKKDRETFAAFAEHLIEPRWVSPTAQALLDAALDYMLGDRESLDDLRDEISALLKRVEQLFLSLDSNLNFRLEPFDETAEAPVPAQDNGARELDLRGIACPMNFVRAKIQLEQLENGEVLHILLDDGEPVRNVPASFAEQGQEVLSVTGEGPHFRVSVRKVL